MTFVLKLPVQSKTVISIFSICVVQFFQVFQLFQACEDTLRYSGANYTAKIACMKHVTRNAASCSEVKQVCTVMTDHVISIPQLQVITLLHSQKHQPLKLRQVCALMLIDIGSKKLRTIRASSYFRRYRPVLCIKSFRRMILMATSDPPRALSLARTTLLNTPCPV